jgi:NAD(P)-dependent dehydrogenase (short-subunit alcohol dehydrogenase family)
MEYAQQKLRVNSVSPGIIKTDIWANTPPGMLDELSATIPIQRVGEAEDVAQAVVWLCSDAASFITGQNLVIDGGYTVQS